MIYLTVPQKAKQNHWIFISCDNPQRKSLKTKLESRMKSLSSTVCNCKPYYKKIKLDDQKTCPCSLGIQFREQYREIYKYIVDNLEEIVIGSIEDLQKHVVAFTQLVNLMKNKKAKDLLHDELKAVFFEAYHDFSEGRMIRDAGVKSLWGAYEYVKLLQATVCPYCNAQFTLIIENDPKKKGMTRPTLDHFLPKMKRPIFSVSLYNLVPSCYICNSSFKGKKETSFDKNFSPYEEGIDVSFKFVRDFHTTKKRDPVPDYIQAILGESEEYAIKIYGTCEDEAKRHSIAAKVQGNVDLFRLDDVYACHKLHLQKIILNARLYDLIYRQQMANAFPEVFSSQEQLLSLVQYTPEEMKFTILGKLTTDIIKHELL